VDLDRDAARCGQRPHELDRLLDDFARVDRFRESDSGGLDACDVEDLG